VVGKPVDATRVPTRIDRPARTVMNAFHHFPRDVAARIVADAVARRRALFIVESFPRNPLRLLPSMPFLSAAQFANPFLAERDRLAKFLLNPLSGPLGMWDAVVSTLRIHDERDLRTMAAAAGGVYDWHYRESPYPWGGIATAFFGIPGRNAVRSRIPK